MPTFEQVRREAINQMPYASACLLSMTPVAHDQCPGIFADDEWHIYYNPSLVESDELCNSVHALKVEVVKLFQNHSGRIEALLPRGEHASEQLQRVAIAVSDSIAKAIVNDSVNELNFIDGLRYVAIPTIESMYRKVLSLLPPAPHQPGQGPNGESQNGNGQSQSPQGGSSQTNNQKPNSNSNSGSGGQSNAGNQGSGGQQQSKQRQNNDIQSKSQHIPQVPEQFPKPEQSGSSSDGVPRPWETHKQETQQDRDAKANGKGEQQGQNQGEGEGQGKGQPHNQQTVQKMLDHLKQHGHDVGNSQLMNWVDTVTQRHNPRSLSSIIRQYTETTRGHEIRRTDGRNRRQGSISAYNKCQMVLARDVAPKLEILIVLDTSGSMERSDSRRALRWVADCLRKHGISKCSAFYTGNTTPAYQGPLSQSRARSIAFNGNGGTEMDKVCNAAFGLEKLRGGAPNLCLCLTDCGTGWGGLNIPIPLAIYPVFDEKSYTYESYIAEVLHQCPVPSHAHLVK